MNFYIFALIVCAAAMIYAIKGQFDLFDSLMDEDDDV